MYSIKKGNETLTLSKTAYYSWLKLELEKFDESLSDNEEVQDDASCSGKSTQDVPTEMDHDMSHDEAITDSAMNFDYDDDIDLSDILGFDDFLGLHNEDEEDDDDTNELAAPGSSDSSSICTKTVGNDNLFRTLVEYRVNVTAINAILKVLRQYSNPSEIWNLPAVFKTAVGPYPNFDIDENIDDSDDKDESGGSDLDSIFGDNNINRIAARLKMQDKLNRGVLIYFGIKDTLESGAADFDPNCNTLAMDINVDGLPLFESAKSSFWPILGRFGDYEPFEIALYYGRSKPRYSNKFFKKFVAEFKDLQYGFSLKRTCRTYQLKLNSACFDSPARSFSLNTPYFNARRGCHKCHVEGVWISHRMCFLDVDAAPRTREEFYDTYLREGEKFSELMKIEGFDPVLHCPMDPMHVVDLIVVRKLMVLWTGKGSEFSIAPSLKLLLSERLNNIRLYCPIEFQRKPRTLDDLTYFKAKEYRAILLYLGPIIFKDILPIEQYRHFLNLHVAYRILNDKNSIKEKENIEYARQLLRAFVADFQHIYKPEFVSYGVHALIHLADDVEYFRKTAIELSAYAFESRLGFIGGLVRSGHLPAKQVARRMYEFNYFGVRRSNSKNKRLGLDGKYFRTPEYTFDSGLANKYCEIDNQLNAIHHFECRNDQTYVFSVPILEITSVYSTPWESTHFGTFNASLPDQNHTNDLICRPASDITGKYYCILLDPKSSQCAFSKLIH